ncbi:MAG: type II secretion system F family protein [Patescibacteria group bacterium]|nr:type II secretion system F family protein [Patescibacteria group bacterium]
MKFNYKARNKAGIIQSGDIEASSKDAALILLQRHNLYVTSLEKSKKTPFYFKRIKIFEKVSQKDLVMFTRQFSIMIESRISLIETLKVIASQTKDSFFKEIILEITEKVKGGSSLSQAIALYPKVFSDFYVNMVKSGEASGTLSETLNYLADYLEKKYHVNSKIVGAMIYPAFILFVMLSVMIVMTSIVIPKLTDVLKESEAQLPFMTKAVIGASMFFNSWGWILLLILIVMAIIAVFYLKGEEGKKVFGKLVLKMPMFGPFFKKFYISRFAENLSVLISGGISITKALDLSGRIIENNVYKRAIFEIRDEVTKGEKISSTLIKFPELFSPIFVQMVLVGERTGTVGNSLTNVVTFYEKEIDRSINSFLALLEPLLIVFLGLVVAFVALAVLVPIYQLPAGI